MERLSDPEIAELCRRARAGDIQARNRIVERSMGAIAGIARQFRVTGIDRDDLMQEGAMAAMRAAELYDPAMGASFITYARPRIRRDMRLAIDNHSRTIRVPPKAQRLMVKWNRVARTLSERWGRAAAVEDIASEAGISIGPSVCVARTWRYVAGILACRETESYRYDGHAVEGPTPLDAMVTREDLARLFRATAGLADEQRRMIELCFGMEDGVARDAAEAGRIMGIPPRRSQRLIRRAYAALAVLMAA
jgi:RNA polymerase primary sigma factor